MRKNPSAPEDADPFQSIPAVPNTPDALAWFDETPVRMPAKSSLDSLPNDGGAGKPSKGLENGRKHGSVKENTSRRDEIRRHLQEAFKKPDMPPPDQDEMPPPNQDELLARSLAELLLPGVREHRGSGAIGKFTEMVSKSASRDKLQVDVPDGNRELSSEDAKDRSKALLKLLSKGESWKKVKRFCLGDASSIPMEELQAGILKWLESQKPTTYSDRKDIVSILEFLLNCLGVELYRNGVQCYISTTHPKRYAEGIFTVMDGKSGVRIDSKKHLRAVLEDGDFSIEKAGDYEKEMIKL